MKNQTIKSIIVLSCICLVVALILSAVNNITAPIIEEQMNAAANGAYLQVLPNATTFTDVTGEFPENVLEMKKDEGGTGFAFKLQSSSSYSKSPMQMILGIDNTGLITKLVITNYAETKGAAADFEALFAGKDATMTDVVAGVTYTTNAIKDAVKAAYDVFYEYADIEKSDEQKLMELYSKLLPYGTDKTGGYAMTAIDLPEGAPASVTAVYEANTGVGYIVTATAGDKTVAMGVNAYGKVSTIFDLDGNDLSADANIATLIEDVEANLSSIYETNHDAIIEKMIAKEVISAAGDAKKVDFSAVSNRVVAVYEVKGGTAYVARAEGFGGIVTVCYVINSNGEIVKYATLEQNETANDHDGNDYGTAIKFGSYAEKINGKDVNSLTDEDVSVAGSTFTSTATKACWKDVKSAFETMNKEGAK
jgi:Na+-translocating ferredoxin:NAD+ oxidoreductase RnfG subunit